MARDGAGDFDGNGTSDVLWRNVSTGANMVWLMNGTQVSSDPQIAAVSDTNFHVAGIGDFNGDGKADILWRNTSTGENAVWLMNGPNTFVSTQFTTPVADLNWQIVGIGDFDGDDKSDVLWRNVSTGQNMIWFMDGTQVRSSVSLATVADTNFQIVGVGDFNGDGKADILWRSISTGENAVWLMNGGNFISTQFTAQIADQNWQVVGIGDFDGDGKSDVLWRNLGTGQNMIWFMNGTQVSSAVSILTASNTNFHVVGVGDFNADGRADILWRNMTTGDNAVWLMNGASVISTQIISAEPEMNWQVVGVTPVLSTHSTSTQAVNHVIFMLQENRSFDNYFGMLNPYRKSNGWNIGDDGKEYDVDGLDGSKASIPNPVDQGTGPNGTTPSWTPFKLQTSCTDDMTSAWLESFGDVNIYDFSTTRSINMNGFVHIAENYNNPHDPYGRRAMGYYDQGFLNYYYYMASQFAVSDRWFTPVASKTVPNRIATITGGTTQGLVRDPTNDDRLHNQLNIETIFQELDQAGVSWKIYYTNTDIGDPFPATTFGYFAYSDNYMYGGTCSPPTTNVNGACIDTSHIAPIGQFISDVQNGTLPQFAYIEPGYNDCTDEHPSCDVTQGQAAVANLINTFMTSVSWRDSVFFLSYDEGGGPYDHVAPVPNHTNQNTDSSLGITTDISSIAVNPDSYFPCAPPNPPTATLHCDLQNYGGYQDPGWNSGDAAAQQGFAAQLGFRLPNIVISPFTRRHYVSHIPMDHTAIIKFVENRFIGSSAHLTARDAAQPNLLDFFDFNNVPWATPPGGAPTPAAGSCNPGNL